MIEFATGHRGRESEISALFLASFAASEGAEEGQLIARLVSDLMEKTPEADLLVFSACDGPSLVGCIFFSRLTYELDERKVFILSPVAVKPDRQKQGIGQKLLAFGLAALRQRSVDIAITYGDPAYYGKSGFKPIGETFAQPPLKLTQPHGWLAQPLSQAEMPPLTGPSRCVEALNNPQLW